MSPAGYLSGFGNHFATEALQGALPPQNSPQRCPYGLYAEQISGTAFTAPRGGNRRSWMYRLRPTAAHGPFDPVPAGAWSLQFLAEPSPDRMRWNPLPIPEVPTDFIEGLLTMAGHGGPQTQSGCAILLYAANRGMGRRAAYDADAELLIVPQLGTLRIRTEHGLLELAPLEIGVIPRGVRFSVELPDGHARGYVCENFAAPLRLPDLGPIGSNGLACERDFHTPVAAFEDREERWELLARFMGRLWRTELAHSPFDVVAWRGNYAPYKYDLRRFNTMGSISFDHPDPSIFLVLQSPTDTPGVDSLDLVLFPPRWLAMQDTFRPPWFHRNVASEFMGLIQGSYDAKREGFTPGSSSLHNCMSAHGPDVATFEAASSADTRTPVKLVDTMAFMFETRWVIQPTRLALDLPQRQPDYWRCWQGFAKHFDERNP